LSPLPQPFADWFAARGWQPHPHQLALLAAAAPSTLLIAPTGGGKTLAGFLPSLVELGTAPPGGLHTLYVSPLKALAADIRRNLATPVAEMGLAIRVEDRTGDTGQAARRRQRVDPPHILLTTPESLALMLSYEEAPRIFAGCARVVVDEIHALAEIKRGDQLMLGLARLRRSRPACAASGSRRRSRTRPASPPSSGPGTAVLRADPGPEPDISMLETAEPPPWAGGGGRHAARAVLDLVARRDDHADLHQHPRPGRAVLPGALGRERRRAADRPAPRLAVARGARPVEAAMVAGELRAVVCTGSLDLGIDWGASTS
jgi:ATP-dependent helicase Lhr and Lhr-like helicase